MQFVLRRKDTGRVRLTSSATQNCVVKSIMVFLPVGRITLTLQTLLLVLIIKVFLILVGNHSGSLDGVQYFSCPPNYGTFVHIEDVLCITTPKVKDL